MNNNRQIYKKIKKKPIRTTYKESNLKRTRNIVQVARNQCKIGKMIHTLNRCIHIRIIHTIGCKYSIKTDI